MRYWPIERWSALIDRIASEFKSDIVIVGAVCDHERNKEIAEQANCSPEVKTTTIPELQAAIDAADILVCLDSAPLHLAVLKDKPVLALFGPGVVPLYEPITPASRVVHHQELFECAPCPQTVCVQPVESACMLAITVDVVFGVFEEMVDDR